jgi:hypothetical protein
MAWEGGAQDSERTWEVEERSRRPCRDFQREDRETSSALRRTVNWKVCKSPIALYLSVIKKTGNQDAIKSNHPN